jgi:hypothetical protein
MWKYAIVASHQYRCLGWIIAKKVVTLPPILDKKQHFSGMKTAVKYSLYAVAQYLSIPTRY